VRAERRTLARNMDQPESAGKPLVAVDVVACTLTAALAILNPAAGVAAAGLSPVLVRRIKRWVAERRATRVEYSLDLAVQLTSLDADEFAARCEENPATEQLLLRVIEASENTVSNEKLIAYAIALANGTLDRASVDWETTFVRVLDDLDQTHLFLLERFTTEGRGGGRPEFDAVPKQLNSSHLASLASDLPNLPSLVAGLQRNGLISSEASGGGATGPAGAQTVWTITEFGKALLERLYEVGESLRQARHDREDYRTADEEQSEMPS